MWAAEESLGVMPTRTHLLPRTRPSNGRPFAPSHPSPQCAYDELAKSNDEADARRKKIAEDHFWYLKNSFNNAIQVGPDSGLTWMGRRRQQRQQGARGRRVRAVCMRALLVRVRSEVGCSRTSAQSPAALLFKAGLAPLCPYLV